MLATFFFFISPLSMAVPMPAMFIWERVSLLRPLGSIMPNIFPMKSSRPPSSWVRAGPRFPRK